MIKKIFGILAVLCISLATVWAADFSTTNGDFISFHLRESQDTTMARYDALIKQGIIWDQESEQDGTLHFTTQLAEDVFNGGLYFEHKQLVRIKLIQRDGRKIAKADKLESYIHRKLMRAIVEVYGEPRHLYDFPDLNQVKHRPYIIAEWFKWEKQVVVCVIREKKKYYAATIIEGVEGTGRHHRGRGWD